MSDYRYKIYGDSHKKVIFFFPAGFTPMWWYRITVWQLNRMGYTVVGFDLNWKKLVYNLGLDGLIGIIFDIEKTVLALQESEFKKCSDFALFGTSFGTLIATHIAKNQPAFRSIILNMPYGKLSRLIWTYKPARTFKQKMISQGVTTEEQLYKLLLPIEPTRNLELLADRQIVNFIALSDKIVSDGQYFADELKNAVPTTTFHATKFGHFWGGIENILSKRKWSKIL